MSKQKNNTFQRCGEMLIKFDANGRPDYGFTYDAYHGLLTKFYDLQEPTADQTASPVKTIELPTWHADVDNQAMLSALQYYATPQPDAERYDRIFAQQALEDYAKGGMRLAAGCFHGLPNLQLTLTGDYSVMLDWGCFDDHAQVELVLPHAMALKQVFRTFDTGVDYAHENWTLVAHRDFNFNCDYARDSYDVCDFDPRRDNERYQLTVTHPQKLTTLRDSLPKHPDRTPAGRPPFRGALDETSTLFCPPDREQ